MNEPETRPDLAPIRAGDSDALERLKSTLAELEATQQLMKDANKAIRRHRGAGLEAQRAALIALGLSPDQASDLTTPDGLGCVGFPFYSLNYNAASIRNVRARIKRNSRG